MTEYPEESDLLKIKNWPFEQGYGPLMEFVESIWWMPEWGFSRRGSNYRLATGGWSGNEDIIDALGQNFIFWSQCWKLSKTGGLYVFHIPKRFLLATSQTEKRS